MLSNKSQIVISEEVLKSVFDEHYESLCIYLNSFTRDSDQIKEIVQEVFIKLWEGRFDQHIQEIKPYLYTAARNRALNYLRDKKTEEKQLEAWSLHESDIRQGHDCRDMEASINLLQQAIQELPPKCKEIFILAKMDGWSYQKIAEQCNLSVKTIENQMGIAMRKLRESMLILIFILLKDTLDK
jgi:RNA polymerase sigma-70 factor (family 1)